MANLRTFCLTAFHNAAGRESRGHRPKRNRLAENILRARHRKMHPIAGEAAGKRLT